MDKVKGKVILLGSEGCGCGDDDLGFEILATLLEALIKREDRPIAIICWNTAVRLLAENSPLITRFKQLSENSVDILAGKLCVEDLELTGKMAVGRVATMGEILDLILHNDVISL